MLVLLVDDERFFRLAMKSLLEREGFEVIAACGGIEAYGIIEKVVGIDLLIAHLLMPGMDGLELADGVRNLHPNLPILFISGIGLPLRHKPPGCGFLRKPFHL